MTQSAVSLSAHSVVVTAATELLQNAESFQDRSAAFDKLLIARQQEMEYDVLQQTLAARKRGQGFGVVISLAWLIGAVTLGVLGRNPWAGAVFGSVDLVPILAILVLGKTPKLARRHSGEARSPSKPAPA